MVGGVQHSDMIAFRTSHRLAVSIGLPELPGSGLREMASWYIRTAWISSVSATTLSLGSISPVAAAASADAASSACLRGVPMPAIARLNATLAMVVVVADVPRNAAGGCVRTGTLTVWFALASPPDRVSNHTQPALLRCWLTGYCPPSPDSTAKKTGGMNSRLSLHA